MNIFTIINKQKKVFLFLYQVKSLWAHLFKSNEMPSNQVFSVASSPCHPPRVILGSWTSIIQKKPERNVSCCSLPYQHCLGTGCCEAWERVLGLPWPHPLNPAPPYQVLTGWPQGPALLLQGPHNLVPRLQGHSLGLCHGQSYFWSTGSKRPHFHATHRIHKSGVAQVFRAGLT